MRSYSKFIANCLLGTLLFAGMPLVSIDSAHAAKADEKPQQKTRRVPSMSERVFKKLAEAQEAIDVKDYNLAIEVMRGMLKRSKSYNGNEIGQVHNMLGYVYFLQEDYKGAIREYAAVVAQGDKIPEGLEVTTLYTLAQLSFVEDQYQDALDYMEEWISRSTNPDPASRNFMAQVYYQMKDYSNAIVQMELCINIARDRNTTIKENWWQLINFLYFEKENWPKVIETLEIMVRDFPKREYWVRLAGMHGQQNNEIGHLHTLQAAYVGGYLTKESDLTNLAGLLMQSEIPFTAAKVLAKGIDDEIIETNAKNLRSLGQAWQLSQEVDKAIPVFQNAAKLSDDGRIYERLAYLFLDADKYEQCVVAANGALNKGGVKKKQTVYIARGMCLFNQDKLTAARGSFVSCRNESRKEEDTSNTRICAQWITYIDREKNRLEQLAAAAR